jgi:hypothetical protein
MLDHSFTDCITIGSILLLQVDYSLSHTRGRRRPLRNLLNSDSVKLVLVNLVPVGAAFFSAHETYDWTKHYDEVNIIVPDHLPKVGERVARALGLLSF